MIIFSTSQKTKYLLLIFGNHNVITIFDQANGLQNNQKISFFSNNSKIFSSISKSNFVIINNQTMIGFKYQEQLKESWLFRVSLKVIDIFQIGDNLAIQLEQCKEIKIDLENMIYQQINYSSQQNCTYLIDNKFFIAISKNEIKIESATSLKLTYTFNTLLQHIYFVDIEYLILFELQGTQIIAKLYNLSSQKLNFLYNLPFYDFEIIQPISYKVAKTYLAIIVINQQSQYFLMVYNIKQIATNCLIKVIEIDPNYHQFNFIDQSQIYIQFRNQITVYFLQWVFLNLSNFQFDSNTYFYKQFVVVQKKSDFFLQIQNITVQLISTNANYQLQVKNQSIPVYYSIKQQNKEIILDNVFGNIDQIEYKNKNGQTIKLNPIIIVDQYSCLYPFYNQICIQQSEQIVLNYFDKQNQVVINLPEITLSQYQFFRKVNNNYELFLVFSNSEGRKYVINQFGQILNNKTISIRQVFPDLLLSDTSLTVVGNFGILKSNVSTSLIFLILENSLQLFYELGEGNEVNGHCTIKILYQKDSYIIFNSRKFQMETFTVYILNNQFYTIKKIEISLKYLIPEYDVKILSCLIQIEIIEYVFQDFIFEADLILCFEYLLCQRMHLQINFNNEKLEFQAISTVRYPNLDYKIKEVNLLSYKYLIIQYQGSQIISYFYNLNNKDAQILDSFYQYVKNVEFQLYDQSQQIEITKKENFVELKLINIQAYTIQCQQQCLQGSEDILISNQVSKLQITLNPKIKEEQSIKLKSLLIVLNFIILIMYLKIRITKKASRNQYNK
ncbi:unnamed protein product [Paramecium pentaurelia]|uniref:Transmembrane protein n=1 Tax=Paramecium pentaurelia TaxID=43138 RepID=A0A8S1YDA1_9CILI|nr:unnamed protein product [Paramecium pentaurelia]